MFLLDQYLPVAQPAHLYQCHQHSESVDPAQVFLLHQYPQLLNLHNYICVTNIQNLLILLRYFFTNIYQFLILLTFVCVTVCLIIRPTSVLDSRIYGKCSTVSFVTTILSRKYYNGDWVKRSIPKWTIFLDFYLRSVIVVSVVYSFN